MKKLLSTIVLFIVGIIGMTSVSAEDWLYCVKPDSDRVTTTTRVYCDFKNGKGFYSIAKAEAELERRLGQKAGWCVDKDQIVQSKRRDCPDTHVFTSVSLQDAKEKQNGLRSLGGVDSSCLSLHDTLLKAKKYATIAAGAFDWQPRQCNTNVIRGITTLEEADYFLERCEASVMETFDGSTAAQTLEKMSRKSSLDMYLGMVDESIKEGLRELKKARDAYSPESCGDHAQEVWRLTSSAQIFVDTSVLDGMHYEGQREVEVTRLLSGEIIVKPKH